MFLEDLPEPDENCATCLLNDICSSNINSKDSRCKKHLLERSDNSDSAKSCRNCDELFQQDGCSIASDDGICESYHCD